MALNATSSIGGCEIPCKLKCSQATQYTRTIILSCLLLEVSHISDYKKSITLVISISLVPLTKHDAKIQKKDEKKWKMKKNYYFSTIYVMSRYNNCAISNGTIYSITFISTAFSFPSLCNCWRSKPRSFIIWRTTFILIVLASALS